MKAERTPQGGFVFRPVNKICQSATGWLGNPPDVTEKIYPEAVQAMLCVLAQETPEVLQAALDAAKETP